VKQLGGLSFQLNTGGGQTQVIATALQQQWAQCGINVTQNVTVGAQASANYVSGNYQIAVQVNGGIFDPAIYVPLYSVPTAADDKFGFNSPTVTNLLDATNLASNPTALQNIWTRVWGTEDKLAVNIPIISGPNLYFTNKCLKNVGFIEAGQIFRSAYFAC